MSHELHSEKDTYWVAYSDDTTFEFGVVFEGGHLETGRDNLVAAHSLEELRTSMEGITLDTSDEEYTEEYEDFLNGC